MKRVGSKNKKAPVSRLTDSQADSIRVKLERALERLEENGLFSREFQI